MLTLQMQTYGRQFVIRDGLPGPFAISALPGLRITAQGEKVRVQRDWPVMLSVRIGAVGPGFGLAAFQIWAGTDQPAYAHSPWLAC